MKSIKSMSVAKRIIVGVVVFICLAFVAWLLLRIYTRPGVERSLSFSELLSAIQDDKVAAIMVSEQQVTGRYKNSEDTLHAVMPADFPEFYRLVQEHHVDLAVQPPGTGFVARVGGAAGPFLQMAAVLLLIIIFLIVKNIPEAEAKAIEPSLSTVSFEEIVGLDQVKTELRFIIDYLQQPGAFLTRKVSAPKVLLLGPPGTGKTLLTHAVAREAKCPVFSVSASELLFTANPAQVIRKTLEKAKAKAPAILLIDRIDKCAYSRDFGAWAQAGASTVIIGEIARQLKRLEADSRLVVVATASDPGAIPAELVEMGRFDHRIQVRLPDHAGRKAILESALKSYGDDGHIANDVNLDQIAAKTAGFTGAELTQILKVASLTAMREKRGAKYTDLDEAALTVTRLRAETANRTSFVGARAALYALDDRVGSFDDAGGLEPAKEALKDIVRFLRAPDEFTKLDAHLPRGVLLVGPPGTGKTLLAQAVAAQAQCPFFSIAGSAFIELFVGVGASRIRDLFERAQRNAPCIIFIDELDAIARKRSGADLPSSREHDNAVNEFLTQLDGFTQQLGVVVLGATNRPDMLDPAVLRPGRFDRQVTVPLPDRAAREQIFQIHLKRKQERLVLAEDVRVTELARKTDGFSGAEIAALINEAAIRVVRDRKAQITMDDFEACLSAELPSEACLAELDKASDDFIVGHAAAKAAMRGLVKLHYGQSRATAQRGSALPAGKSCLLLLGPRGTGKTTLIRKVAAHLGVPFYSCPADRLIEHDGSRYTPTELLMREVMAASDGKTKRAQHAIICLEKIERVFGLGSSPGVQNSLARLIKGTVVEVPLNPKFSQVVDTSLRTHEMLFCLEGNLESLEAVIKRRYQGQPYVSMKTLVNDEEVELVRNGIQTDLMNAISMVSVCAPLSETELGGILAGLSGVSQLQQFQAVLDVCGVPVRLDDRVNQIAKKAYRRQEEGAGIANVLRDICAAILSRPIEQAQRSFDESVDDAEESAVYDDHYKDLDPALILTELPSELGAVTRSNLPQRRVALVLVEQPEGTAITGTTAKAILVWLRERTIPVSKAGMDQAPGNASALQKLSPNLAASIQNLHQMLVEAIEKHQPPPAARAVDLVVKAIEQGDIDHLKAQVLLRGIAVRSGYDLPQRPGSALSYLIQAHRSFSDLDLVTAGFELKREALDEIGSRSARVAAVATALKDGLAEIEGDGKLIEQGNRTSGKVEEEDVAKALTDTPNLKLAICSVVARLRESLGFPIIELDGIAVRREWSACKPRLQRRGDIRNTRNLMLLLAATDACVKALSVVRAHESREMVETLKGHIFGHTDRHQARMQYWRDQLRGVQHLLQSEKCRENLLLWQNYGFDWERMRAELPQTVFSSETQFDLAGNQIFEVLEQYYGGLTDKAVDVCKELLNACDKQSPALLVDEFDAEAIMQYCTQNNISYITIVPASS